MITDGLAHAKSLLTNVALATLLVVACLFGATSSVASGATTSPAKFTATVSATTEIATVKWKARSGQSISGLQVRFRHAGGAWGNWTNMSAGSAEVNESEVGEKLRGQIRDATTKVSVWEGRTLVGPRPECSVAQDGPATSPEAQLTPTVSEEPSVAVTFASPVTLDDLAEATESADVSVQQLIQNTPLPDSQIYTVGLASDPSESNAENLETFRTFVAKDARRYASELAAESTSPEDGASSEVSTADTTVDQLAALADDYSSTESAEITQVALTGPLDEIGTAVDDLGEEVEKMKTGAPIGDCPGVLAARAGAAPMATNGIDPSTYPDPIPAKSKDYTPRAIDVKTFNQVFRKVSGARQQVRKAEVSFTWCANCVKYWNEIYQQSHETYDRSGVEVQLNLGLDGDGNFWGNNPWTNPLPAWAGNFNPPGDDASAGVAAAGIPRAWSANFPCAYAEDYSFDAGGSRNVAVGSYCPPGSWTGIDQRWRWAQILLTGDGANDENDSVRPSVQPVRQFLTADEEVYCNGRSFVPGACMFGVGTTHGDGGAGVGYRDYYRVDAQLDSEKLVTPGKAKFFRAEIAGGPSGWPTSPLRHCVDKGSVIAYNIALPAFEATLQSLTDHIGSFHSLLPYNFQTSGLGIPYVEGVLRPYMGSFSTFRAWAATTSPLSTLYGAVVDTDLGAQLAWSMYVERSIFNQDIDYGVLGGGIFFPEDSHVNEFDIPASIIQGQCVPVDTTIPT